VNHGQTSGDKRDQRKSRAHADAVDDRKKDEAKDDTQSIAKQVIHQQSMADELGRDKLRAPVCDDGAGQSTSLIVGSGTYTGGNLVVEGERRDGKKTLDHALSRRKIQPRLVHSQGLRGHSWN